MRALDLTPRVAKRSHVPNARLRHRTIRSHAEPSEARAFGSLVAETLEEMATDVEFQTAQQRLSELGQRALTKEERARRRRALDGLGVPSFEDFLEERGGKVLEREPTTILQVNIGLYCNQACSHCHVESSPLRTSEVMDERTAEQVIRVLKNSPGVRTLDLTGGAPELHKQFRYLVTEARALGVEVIDRCNLTVLYEEGQEDLPQFLAENKVKVVASLPCYSEANTDAQRGRGVFERSIAALKDLNAVGYGVEGTGLELDLMYNPGGAFLPPAQAKLEEAYRSELRGTWGVEFSRLFTLTNMPIKRFADYLHKEDKTSEYMSLLVNNFNVAASVGVMCRDLISVSWDGRLFDCDFNQQLDMPVRGAKTTIFDLNSCDDLVGAHIVADNHCFGCTAGSGSSCSGATI